MNATVKEWMEKSDADYRSARRELGVKDERNNDLVCFLAQQSIEKLMKALLVSKGILPPKVHDLSVLDGLVKEAYPLWHWNSVELQELTTAAVEFRYPGMSATPEIAERLFEFAGAMRKELLKMIEE